MAEVKHPMPAQDHSRLGCRRYSAKQVQELFSVCPATVIRWADEGRLPYLKTLGGHRRYDADAVDAIIANMEDS